MYNLCRILQHVVNGFYNVSLIPNWGKVSSTDNEGIFIFWLKIPPFSSQKGRYVKINP